MATRAPTPIDEYLEALADPAARKTLTTLTSQLRKLLPGAEETLSYSMPAFRLPNGKVAAGFAFFGKNCGYYPHSGNVVGKMSGHLKGFKVSKGGVTFPPDQPLPAKAVEALVKARLAEIGTAPPRRPARRSASAKAPRKNATTTAKRKKMTAKVTRKG